MISYHDTVNDVPANHSWGNGPFARREWFALLERAGARPRIALASDGRDMVILPLMAAARGLASLTNWYAFTWAPFGSFMVSQGPWVALAADLAKRTDRIEFTKVPDENGLASLLEQSFRAAGWRVLREACDVNHILPVNGRSYAQFLADRPGPLRTTLKRKAKKVEVRLSAQFDPADWAAYEAIYADSWKPEEGDPAMLRAFAEAESAAGRFRFGLAFGEGKPVAAQFWTVEGDTAYIHKLAHRTSADKLSPGTTLTAALFERVIDTDKVALVDFGTGDDAYKRDWMEAVRTRWQITCLRPGAPRNWPELAKWMLRGRGA